ncbi:MAG: PilZ domain-containing protein [Propionivibrio sp.]
MTDDRRRYARIAFSSPARLLLAARSVDVVVLDLSLKGALIRLPSDSPLVDDETGVLEGVLQVRLDEDVAGAQISMQVRVAHVDGDRTGLLCLSIDLDSVTHLRRLVELNLGDPRLLERELSALLAG